MKIICPYTTLTEGTEMVLKAEHRNEVEFVDVSATQESYFWLMHRCWKEAQTFVVIEHDIVPWPGAIRAIHDCESILCAYQAPIGTFNGEYSGLGLGVWKLGKSLLEKFPDHLDDPTLTRLWHKVDGEMISRLVYDKGIEIHYHHPPVVHLSKQRFG
jgi:hypothetical protein